jgi:type I pantothenate kinase
MLRHLTIMLAERAATVTGRPLLVGLTGPVSVGKTTIAVQLADELRVDHGLKVSVVSTDGFLFPNAELEQRGLSMQKGFPASFDTDRLSAFLAAVRYGGATLAVPVYDHLSYDVRVGETATIEAGDVLIVEGVNALLPAHIEAYDFTIYVDAPDAVVVDWFVTRLRELVKAAADDANSFYAPLAAWPDEQVRQFAQAAWDGINAINREQHIRPTRAHANAVIEKTADHAVVGVSLRGEAGGA